MKVAGVAGERGLSLLAGCGRGNWVERCLAAAGKRVGGGREGHSAWEEKQRASDVEYAGMRLDSEGGEAS